MRHVIVHYHIYKNSGTSFERVLDESFGDAHERFDGPYPFFTIDQDQLDRIIRRKPGSVAFSSHQTMLPQPSSLDHIVLAATFLRHPILRIGSIYRFKRQHEDGTSTAEIAHKHDFAGFIAACFDVTKELPHISNGRTRHLAAAHGRAPAVRRLNDMMQYDLATAKRNLANVEMLGRTEHFEDDVARFVMIAARHGLTMKVPAETRHNTTETHDLPVAKRVEQLLEPLSAQLKAQLMAANEQDLELYAHAETLIAARDKAAG